MKIKKKETIIILGGGLAGLAAGYELSRKKMHVIVVEQQDDVGGLARTIEKNGFRFDTGPHRWYTKNNAVNDWMLSLLTGEVIQVPRLTRIYFDKHFFYYPIKLKNALQGIGPWKAIKAVMDYLIARIRVRFFSPILLTMEDGYISQFGRTLYEIFFKRYSEKLWGIPCTEVSIDWVGQRTRGLNILTIIKDMLIKNKNVVSLVDEFSYPKDGVGRIADKLKERIIREGGSVLVDTEVTALKHVKNRIVSVDVVRDKKKAIIVGDHFISTIPLNDLVKRMVPKVEKHVLDHAGALTYRDELQVALFIKKTHITPDTWIYVHPKDIPFMRVMEMDNWSDTLSRKGTTTIVFEIACNEGDAMWKKSDPDIIELVTRSFIDEFQLVTRNDIIGGYVHRVPKEYPVYHIGYRKDLSIIKKYLKRFTNLQIAGRNGTFRYNNMDHSIEMGHYAAWNIIEGKKAYDIESVNIEREYLEEKKIETLEDETVEK